MKRVQNSLKEILLLLFGLIVFGFDLKFPVYERGDWLFSIELAKFERGELTENFSSKALRLSMFFLHINFMEYILYFETQ